MFLERGWEFTYEAVREWEKQYAPLITEQLRIKRRGKAGQSWYVDETYVKVRGKWCYLYRAIDADGNLVDSRLSEKRDMEAAQQFFKQALEVCGHAPERVTTDGHASYPRAVREILGGMCSIGRRNISIIVESKTIAGPSNAIIPCMASETLTPQPVSVVLLTKYGTIFMLALPWENQPHVQNSDEFSSIDLEP